MIYKTYSVTTSILLVIKTKSAESCIPNWNPKEITGLAAILIDATVKVYNREIAIVVDAVDNTSGTTTTTTTVLQVANTPM